MRFTFVESMIDPAWYVPLAQACETHGFNSFAVPDSILYPQHSATPYPYTSSGGRDFLEDQPILDPFVLMAAIAAATTRLCFYPLVYKLPVRQPVLVAKQASSLAVLSNNRLRLGLGLSPWPEDYAACGERWAQRGRRFDEMLLIIRQLLQGGYHSFAGEFYRLDSLKLCPVPSQPVPMLIGGHSDAALQRAAQYGDGWLHGGGEVDELDPLLARLQYYLAEYGRDHDTFQIHAISREAWSPDGVRRLQDKGVTDAIIGFHNTYSREPDPATLAQKIDNIRRFADSVIGRI